MNKAAVLDRLIRFESKVSWMYLDGPGNVTCAIGQLLPTTSFAQTLPWHIDTRQATADEVEADYQAVKVAEPNRAASAYAHLTRCRLDEADMVAIANDRIDGLTADLTHTLPVFAFLPDDVQQAVFDVAYNVGLHRMIQTFPKFLAALRTGDWATAALESRRVGISDARNAEIAGLFHQGVNA